MSKKHKHEPLFDSYYRAFGYNDMFYRVALFSCKVEGCDARGQQEEWPQEDDEIIWIEQSKDDR